MKTTIRQRFEQGQVARVMFLGSLASPKLAEAVGLTGTFDGVWVDQEHSAIPHQQLECGRQHQAR